MKYLIAYYLHDASDYEFETVPDAIYAIDPDTINCFDSVWAVSSDLSAQELRQELEKLIGKSGDKLIVTEITNETELFGFENSELDWLQE